MQNSKSLSISLLFAFVFLFSSTNLRAQTIDPELVRLRQQHAQKYLSADSHLALVRYYWSKGDRIQAFHISEYARRARFPELIFNNSFSRFFGARIYENAEADAIFNKGAEYQKAGKLKLAEDSFVKAAQLAPGSVYIQSWTGRFFFKVRNDSQKALEYYLNAYFLDPHAYDTEYAESRITKINHEMAVEKYGQLIKMGYSMPTILKEQNPTIVFIALNQMTVKWKPAYLEAVLEAMSRDDEGVRWQATEAVMKNAGSSFDEKLQELLSDNDLRKRGLAAYIAIHLWTQNSFEILKNMLREDAELLRFDALSALIQGGGSEGFEVIIKHRQNETHPTLREMIDKSMVSH